MQKTQVRSLVQEDPSCLGVTKPVCHNCWAHVLRLLQARRLEPKLRKKPLQWDGRALQLESSPCLLQQGKSPHSQEDSAQPEMKWIHKFLKMKLPLKNHKRMNDQPVIVLNQIISSQAGDQNCSPNPLAHLTHFWRHLRPCAMPGASGGARQGPCQRNQYLDGVPQTLGFHIPERGTQLPTLCYLSKNIKEKVK